MSKNSLRLEIKKILRDIIESSTSHGFPNIVREKKIPIKILWIICLMVSSAYCAFCLVKSFNEYLSYETNTQFSYQRLSEIEFPTVTFCNKNAFNINKNSSLADLAKTGYGPMKDYADQNILSYKMLYKKVEYYREYNVLEYKNQLDLIAFNIDEMLIDCNYNYRECSSSDFAKFFSPKFGNCYRFNADKDNLKKINSPGKRSGLSLELFVGFPTVQYDLIKSYGAHLFIHNYTVLPFNDYDGVSLSVGQQTDIKVNQLFINKLPKPYSECVTDSYDKKSFDSDLFKETIDRYKKYQQKECIQLCINKLVYEKCGCYHPETYAIKFEEACDYDQADNCLFPFLDKFELNTNCFEKCPEECSTVKYDLVISQASFPTPFYQDILLRYDIANNSTRGFWDYESVKSSTLSVNVYFDDIAITKIDETPSKTTEQLVADIGGFLGLCIGISILSVAEILDAILKIILILFEKFTSTKKIDVPNQSV